MKKTLRDRKGRFSKPNKTITAIMFVSFIMIATAFCAKQAYGETRDDGNVGVNQPDGAATTTAQRYCSKIGQVFHCWDSLETLKWALELDSGERLPSVQADKNTSPSKITKTVTAYNSVPAQTDSSPCISADGSDICKLYAQGDYSCAAALPFGTKLSIPGFGTCTVRDRLAAKYSQRVDIHMGGVESIQKAKNWGKRTLTVTIIN